MADIIFWKPNDFRGTLYSKVSEIADYEFDIGFSLFERAGTIWCTLRFSHNSVLGGFWGR